MPQSAPSNLKFFAKQFLAIILKAVSVNRPYDFAVAYRICPFMSRNPPPVCADSKYQLTSLCLRSFKESVGDLKVKMWVILDKCPPEYEVLVRSLWPAEDLVVGTLSGPRRPGAESNAGAGEVALDVKVGGGKRASLPVANLAVAGIARERGDLSQGSRDSHETK